MNKMISSKHLEGVSDLTLKAPIKQGFIDAFESVTYETRVRLVMKALFKIRQTAREHSLIKPFVDTAERIQSLLDFRLAILEDEEPRHLLLSATFDRPFEPYMRLIWNPLGPLLDVIFCNCEGYVTATEHSFADYLAWVRKSQIDSNFFYSSTGLSIDDIQYLTQVERREREHTRERKRIPLPEMVADTPKQLAHAVRFKDETNKRLANQMGMQALVSLYRLADLYPPDQPDGDGKYLLWATQQLLEGWGRKDLKEHGWDDLVREQLAWLESSPWPGHQAKRERLTFRARDVQGGILHNYGKVRHGALLLMRITDPEKARRFVGRLPVQSERPGPAAKIRPAGGKDAPFLNLAFTRHGLVNIGLPDCELERFPQEFREGMEERAGLILDVRHNHPRRWTLPLRNWPPEAAPAAAPVDMSEVDIVIQLRTTIEYDNSNVAETGHPLHETVRTIGNNPESGLELLAVEAMCPAHPSNGSRSIEHFGFADGLSQPIPVDTPRPYSDEVARGEIFLGYSNNRKDAPPPQNVILDNGTFLVVRKLSQDVPALRRFLNSAKDQIEPDVLLGKMMGRSQSGSPLAKPDAEGNRFSYAEDKRGSLCPFQAHVRRTNPRAHQIDGKPTPRILRRGMSYGPPVVDREKPDAAERGIFFMAYNASIAEQYEVIQRWVNGGNSTGIASWQNDPLMGVGQAGDLRTFLFDHKGQTLRLTMEEPFVRLQWGAYLFVPSMAAIGAIAALSPVDGAEKAREAELREARRGERIVARLLALASEGPKGRIAAAARWKTYLEDFGEKDPAERAEGPAIWAALRAYHGGAIRVPYGIAGPGESPPEVVLVASKELVMRVFDNGQRHYSMCGQMARMKQSFGPIFLGLDEGKDYRNISKINDEILKIGRPAAFALAYSTAAAWLEEVMDLFCRIYGPPAEPPGEGRWGELDLRRDFITPVLAGICNFWFGIPDSLDVEANPKLGIKHKPRVVDACKPSHVDAGGWTWNAVHKPLCPGYFLATSRYCFYPDPVPRVQAYGKAQGQALRKAARAHFEETSDPSAPIAALLNRQFTDKDGRRDEDEIARTLIGVMTGFLPPTDASLRWTLYEWLEEKTFWRIQRALVSAPSPAPPDPASLPPGVSEWLQQVAAIYAKAGMTPDELKNMQDRMPGVLAALPRAEAALLEPLKRAMQKRPSPDMLWRTAVRDHRLGEVDVRDGDRVFIGIVSAMAEDANAGVTDVYPVFGGKREPEGKGCPLHACPAYEFAMGTMMGILAALMDSVRVEALPAPLIVRVSDRKHCDPLKEPPCDAAAVTDAEASPPLQCPYREQAQPGTERPDSPHEASS